MSRSDSAPTNRLVQNAKDKGIAIDATQGRKTKSVLVTSGGYVVLSALLPDTIAGRYHSSDAIAEDELKGEENE
ncbi:MAG: extracellular matrix/biofilm biosynthesis regulator RemA family protein [Lachnospiraceae bacterium]